MLEHIISHLHGMIIVGIGGIDDNSFDIFGCKIYPEGTETDIRQLPTLPAEWDSNDRDHQDTSGEEGLNGKNPSHCDRPTNIQQAIAAPQTAATSFILYGLVRVGECLSEGE